MFEQLNEILSKINYKYALSDSAKNVLTDYVKTQNDQKSFNDLLENVKNKISELKEYGNIQHFIKYPLENEDVEKLLSEIYTKHLEVEGMLTVTIVAKLNNSERKLIEEYKNYFKEYEEIIKKEEQAIKDYNNAVSSVSTFFAKTSKNDIDQIPLSLNTYKEFCNIRDIYDKISIPKELEYRVNIKEYESLIEDMKLLKNIIAKNNEYVKGIVSTCSTLQSEYLNNLFKITKNKKGIAYAQIPLTGEAEIFSKYSNDFNSLLEKNPKLKEYDKFVTFVEFWENETNIFNDEIKKKNKEYDAQKKVESIQRTCLDCVKKVIDGLRISQIEDSLSRIKLPLTRDYRTEYHTCFKEYFNMDTSLRKETEADSTINANFLFLDAFIKKVDNIISLHEKILFFFKKESDLRELCQADIASRKPNGNYDSALNEVKYYYNEIKHLKNIYVENALANMNDVYKRACNRLESYREYRINRSIKRESTFFIILIGLFVLVAAAALAAYSYWGAVFLRSGIMNPFPQWFYKIANVYWFHHWANWGGNVWPVVNLLVWAFEGLWVAITWLIWAIVWLLLMILCGVAYVICYVLVPTAAGAIVGGIFIGLNKIRTKDEDSVVMIILIVLTILAFIALYILCFAL